MRPSRFEPCAGNNLFFHFYCLRFGLLLINPRNIISNIILIFNINSTRGQTRFLTCVARVTCLCLRVIRPTPFAPPVCLRVVFNSTVTALILIFFIQAEPYIGIAPAFTAIVLCLSFVFVFVYEKQVIRRRKFLATMMCGSRVVVALIR